MSGKSRPNERDSMVIEKRANPSRKSVGMAGVPRGLVGETQSLRESLRLAGSGMPVRGGEEDGERMVVARLPTRCAAATVESPSRQCGGRGARQPAVVRERSLEC